MGKPRDQSRCLFCGSRLDARVSCSTCGREAPPLDAPRAAELAAARVGGVACPRCFIGLELSREENGGEFLYCIGCHGCFVPSGDWGVLVDDAAHKTDDAPLAGAELKVLPPEQGLSHGALHERVGCPVCRTDMERANLPQSNETVDICSIHGIWFDAAELSAVLRESASAPGDSEAPTDRKGRQRSAIARFARLVTGG